MKIGISAESTIDMPKELLEKYDIHIVPFMVNVGEQTYKDGEIENEQLFEFFNETKKLPTTSAVNSEQYKEHFYSMLSNYDVVLHLAFSSKVSCAYENANRASNEMTETGGEKRVFVVDTLLLSSGIGLLAIKSKEQITQGKSIEELVQFCESEKRKVKVSLIVDKLNYIVKGGRCSALACFGANLLSIKPLISVEDGKTKVGKKFIGSLENCAKKYVDEIVKKTPNIDKKYVFLSYTQIEQKTKDELTKKLQDYGFENIMYAKASATIACHTGPFALGVIFMEE